MRRWNRDWSAPNSPVGCNGRHSAPGSRSADTKTSTFDPGESVDTHANTVSVASWAETSLASSCFSAQSAQSSGDRTRSPKHLDADLKVGGRHAQPHRALVPLQLERRCPKRNSPRTYDVVIDLGAARRCETARGAFHTSQASQDLIKQLTAAVPAPRAATVRRCRQKAKVGSSHRQQPTALPKQLPRPALVPVKPARPSSQSQSQSPAGSSFSSPSQTGLGGKARRASSLTSADSLLYTDVPDRFHSILVLDTLSENTHMDQLSIVPSALNSPEEALSQRGSGLNTLGALESTESTGFSANGHHGLVVYSTRAGKTANNCVQMRRMGQCMVQSMSRSFPREVWDACDIPHPERECDAGEHERKKAELEKSRRARKAYIEWQGRETEASAEQLHEEREMVALAKESGWSVLDVEEVYEYFIEFSVDGRVSLVGAPFEQLLLRLYRDTEPPHMDKVRGFIQKVVQAHRERRRNNSKKKRKSKKKSSLTMAPTKSLISQVAASSSEEEEENDDETQLTFPEFYFALTRWLHLSANSKAKSKCSLSRFSFFSKTSERASMDSDDEQTLAYLHDDQDEDLVYTIEVGYTSEESPNFRSWRASLASESSSEHGYTLST